MKRMIVALKNLWDTVVHPPPHPIAEEVERAADDVVRQSRKLSRRSDAFADMVKGMRGESRSKTRRGNGKR